jgi:hypothetical protein
MEHKDISVLLIEKNLRPEENEGAAHNIIGTGFFLNSYGFSVEMVWSLQEHRFENFEDFRKESESKRDGIYDYVSDHQLRAYLQARLPSYDLLRSEPIYGIDDLSSYRFIIAHPDCDDSEMLLEFVEKYPNIPVMCPIGSSGIGISSLEAMVWGLRRGQSILPDVIRDHKGVYVFSNPDTDMACVELIEHLLEKGSFP